MGRLREESIIIKNKIGTMLMVFTTTLLNGNRKAFIYPMMNI